MSLASAHQVPTSAPLQMWTSFPWGVVGLLGKAWIRHKDGLWSWCRKPHRHGLGQVPALSLPAPPWSHFFIPALSFSSIKWDDIHQPNHTCCQT